MIMTLWPGMLRAVAVAVSLSFSKFEPLSDILDKRPREKYSWATRAQHTAARAPVVGSRQQPDVTRRLQHAVQWATDERASASHERRVTRWAGSRQDWATGACVQWRWQTRSVCVCVIENCWSFEFTIYIILFTVSLSNTRDSRFEFSSVDCVCRVEYHAIMCVNTTTPVKSVCTATQWTCSNV